MWSIHARASGEPIDYEELFREVARLEPVERQRDDGEKVVALQSVDVSDGLASIVALEGPHGQPILYDTSDGSEEAGALRRAQVVATRTHALVDIARREVIVEYNHRGAKATDIAAALQVSGRKVPGWPRLRVDLSPKADQSFVESIDDFDRIRVATVRIGRPNVDWNDWDDDISDAAHDSDAQSAEVMFSAGRDESLAKDKGLVAFIRDRAEDAVSALKNASVTGRRGGEAAETTVTLGDHKAHQRVNVRLDADGHVLEADINRYLEKYREERE
ncbi:MAG TPA: hypothetical protein VGG08_01875 [Solirubrobacteraceae bacterium]